MDNFIIILLALIVVTGFPAEAFRLLATYTTETGVFAPAPEMLPLVKFPPVLYPVWGPQWGFVGYALAWLLGQITVSAEVWETLNSVLFWLHFVVVTALLYCLPFSRFAHVIMSPVIVAYNTMMDGESRRHRSGDGTAQKKGRGVPQAAA
jgi:nitrate reductase gamma subunit